jgi:hypothetical protein
VPLAPPSPAAFPTNAADSSIAAPTNGADDDAVELAFDALRHVIRTGVLLVNGARATFHVLGGRLHIISPAGWERLSTHCGQSGEPDRARGARLFAALAAGGWLERDAVSGDWTGVYFVHPPNRTTPRPAAIIRLARFSERAQSRLFPAGIPFSDNTDLRREKTLAR